MYLGVEEEAEGKVPENSNIWAAVQVLTKHHQHIDAARALRVMPDKVVRIFMEKIVKQQSREEPDVSREKPSAGVDDREQRRKSTMGRKELLQDELVALQNTVEEQRKEIQELRQDLGYARTAMDRMSHEKEKRQIASRTLREQSEKKNQELRIQIKSERAEKRNRETEKRETFMKFFDGFTQTLVLRDCCPKRDDFQERKAGRCPHSQGLNNQRIEKTTG
eukprot:m.207797 g.207797  ORF g.207797 m.207797 type:complete len:221 (+) comp39697_c2_seq4:1-663(+)